MKPRLAGHSLVWMAVTRAQCECGQDFKLKVKDILGRPDESLQDELMDTHGAHIEQVRRRKR